MGIGALAGCGYGYDYGGYTEAGNRQTGVFFTEYTYKAEEMYEVQDTSYTYDANVYDLYMESAGKANIAETNYINDEDWAKTVSCNYVAESTKNDPVVEVSVIRNGEKITEKVHINDVNPGQCTQQEIKAYLYHYDEANGTEGSYEILMAYAETAQKNGYWDGNGSYEEFANDKYSWKNMFTDVWKGAAYLGLATESTCEESPARKICDTMEHDAVRHFLPDIKNAKLIDMRTNRDKVSIHIEDLLQAVPREIVDYLHKNCFSGASVFFESEGKFIFSDSTFNMLLDRIGEQIKADGSFGDINAAWQSTLKIIENLSAGAGDFYGETLGSDDDTKMNISAMKQLYDSITEKIMNKVVVSKEADVEPEETEDDA